ncbi:microcystin degradation protein MlrC [Arcticibacter tournemirensis]|uniref:M81 family metallopeptidase n=1 Tax=Arcticibacter tournemirensis TaxID=699437 RepID=A0A5M9HBW0_9SPHI|nr:M81 family metallopeptidase [Arcticibacter tournemirensis]KAA8483141.1 M81 family metallopeptidase [Arcticibacter tournemirensis]TQM51943.1 microcystin degradation protein MlrC [Arcticibacter tournemirensis]
MKTFLTGMFLGWLLLPIKVEGFAFDKVIRVLTLGIRNESNTFSTSPTKASDFSVLKGENALKGKMWADFLKAEKVEVIPTLHAYAWPGGVVERSAFESFKEDMLEGVRSAGRLDGIYMDLHGALHVEGYADAQATLIKEIREIAGEDVLICGSFDLHGNPSTEFVKHINMLTAYRTAPHRDEEETRTRAVKMLVDAIRQHLKPHIESVTIPILVPGEKSVTERDPLKSIYSQLPAVASKEGIMDASIFAGYCWADLPRSAMRVFVVAKSDLYKSAARREAVNLAQQIWDCRTKMTLDVPSGTIDQMLTAAGESAGKTVFISDSGDNTTAGAPGDNMNVLAAVLRRGTKNALVAGIVDEDAFKKCAEVGANKQISLQLGGKIDHVYSKPLKVEGKVLYLTLDSEVGTHRAAALLDVNGVYVVVLKARRSFVEIRDFKELGLDPLQFKVVVVKLGYLYPELRDIAPAQLMALTSGFCNLDIKNIKYKNVGRPSYPLDMNMKWSP